jgi:hypothetical protein
MNAIRSRFQAIGDGMNAIRSRFHAIGTGMNAIGSRFHASDRGKREKQVSKRESPTNQQPGTSNIIRTQVLGFSCELRAAS